MYNMWRGTEVISILFSDSGPTAYIPGLSENLFRKYYLKKEKPFRRSIWLIHNERFILPPPRFF